MSGSPVHVPVRMPRSPVRVLMRVTRRLVRVPVRIPEIPIRVTENPACPWLFQTDPFSIPTPSPVSACPTAMLEGVFWQQ